MASAVLGLVLSRDSWAQDVRHLCSEKYQAAKAAGTLNGDSWPQFYSKCTAEAKANPPAAEAAPAAAARHRQNAVSRNAAECGRLAPSAPAGHLPKRKARGRKQGAALFSDKDV